MVVTFPALSNALPPMPAGVAPPMAALLVLVVLLCIAVGILSRLGGAATPARRRARPQTGRRGGAAAQRTRAARVTGPQRASRPRSRVATWRPAL